MVPAVLSSLAVALGALLFFTESPPFVIFSLILPVVLILEWFISKEGAFITAVFTTAIGLLCITRFSPTMTVPLVLQLTLLWGSTLLLAFMKNNLQEKLKISQRRREAVLEEIHQLNKDIAYYEKRRDQLSVYADHRHQVTKVARELGLLSDSWKIQEKLTQTLSRLFKGRTAFISYGPPANEVDKIVSTKKKSLLIPSPDTPGDPLMAVPFSAPPSLQGILHVGGDTGPAFSHDDLRLLEMVGTWASLALGNTALMDHVQELAFQDTLTGLLNHRAFQDQLEFALIKARQNGETLSIILSDMDHFKSVNDNYGHQRGDEILQGYSHILVRNVRDIDVVSRYGGEEFAIYLPMMSNQDSCDVAERIRMDFSGQAFDVGSRDLTLTGSFGVATFPEDGEEAAELIKKADERLYQAKNDGRNRVKGKFL